MPTGEVAQQPVDVHPHLDGQRRIGFEHRIAPAVEGIDHVPRLAKQKQVAGVGNDRIPEVEQQRGPRILPAPGFPQRPAGCDERLRLVAKGRPGLDPNPAHEAVIGEAVGPQQVAVELVELEILEVPQRIAGMRGEHPPTEIQPRVVEERGRERRARAVHARDHEHGRWRGGGGLAHRARVGRTDAATADVQPNPTCGQGQVKKTSRGRGRMPGAAAFTGTTLTGGRRRRTTGPAGPCRRRPARRTAARRSRAWDRSRRCIARPRASSSRWSCRAPRPSR